MAQAGEEAHLDDPAELRIDLLQPLEGLLEGQQVDVRSGSRFRYGLVQGQRHALAVSATLFPVPRPMVVDEHRPHHSAGQCVELGSPVERELVLVDDPEPSLVDQSRRLQRVPGVTATHAVLGEALKLGVGKVQDLLLDAPVACAQPVQQSSRASGVVCHRPVFQCSNGTRASSVEYPARMVATTLASLVPTLAYALVAQGTSLPFDLEGPLNNDAFTPVSERAQEELDRGDRSWKRALADTMAGTRERGLAFEAWHTALEESAVGDAAALSSPDVEVHGLWPDPDETHARRTEGVAYAVLRRLHALDELAATEWVERFEPLSEVALERAGYRAGFLARVERDQPWTRGAALAALRLSDLALERGATEDARAWLTRADEHARGRSEIEAAIRDRRAVLANWEVTRGAASTPTEPDALELVRSERLERIASNGLRQTLRGGLEPGLDFTDAGTVVIQSPIGLVHYRGDARESGPRTLRTRFNDLFGEDWNTPFVTTAEGGWPLLPVVTGRDVVVVIGRSIPRSRGVSFADGEERAPSPTNILARLELDDSGLPEVAWTLTQEGLRDADGTVLEADPFESRAWEVQPGPCVHAGRVFAMVRVTRGKGDGENELWLYAFELRTGAVLWSRFLTKASGLPGDSSTRSSQLPSPAQPLAVVGGRIFAGTNAGLGLLFDSVDGRLVWSFKNRRRTRGEAGWPGARRPTVLELEGSPVVAWGPHDSDRLYTLAAVPDLEGLGIARRTDLAPIAGGAPYALGQAEEVAGIASDEVLVVGREGARAAVSGWSATGERRASIYLGRGESFTGGPWSSPGRVVAASDRYVYLFDRDGDLRLLDALPLPDAGGGRGGSVYALGDQLYIIGQDTLWHFRSR